MREQRCAEQFAAISNAIKSNYYNNNVILFTSFICSKGTRLIHRSKYLFFLARAASTLAYDLVSHANAHAACRATCAIYIWVCRQFLLAGLPLFIFETRNVIQKNRSGKNTVFHHPIYGCTWGFEKKCRADFLFRSLVCMRFSNWRRASRRANKKLIHVICCKCVHVSCICVCKCVT